MSKQQGGLAELLYGKVMPKIYGLGAAVVILGAMFKIMHWPGAGAMLVAGLTTEAIIFIFSAFEPKHPEPDWTKVYPELSEDYVGESVATTRKAVNGNDGVAQKLDHMLQSSNVGPELIDSLGKGMKKLSESVGQMAQLGNASIATNEYTKNVQSASKALADMNKSYGTTISAMADMANASKDTKAYHSQVQSVTKNLGALNAVYEMELQDASQHLKAMNKFYSNVTSAMGNMTQASKDTQEFKEELGKLRSNLASLNKVYGSMLTAMKS
jgi:gliding motility-associated protein GldL